MARLDIIGFETGAVAEVPNITSSSGWTIESTVVATGNYAAKNNSTTSTDQLTINPGGNQDQFYIKFRFRKSANVASTTTILTFEDSGGASGILDIDSSGVLGVTADGGTRQTGPTLSNDVWEVIEVHRDSTNDDIHWRVGDSAQTSSTDGSAMVATALLHFEPSLNSGIVTGKHH